MQVLLNNQIHTYDPNLNSPFKFLLLTHANCPNRLHQTQLTASFAPSRVNPVAVPHLCLASNILSECDTPNISTKYKLFTDSSASPHYAVRSHTCTNSIHGEKQQKNCNEHVVPIPQVAPAIFKSEKTKSRVKSATATKSKQSNLYWKRVANHAFSPSRPSAGLVPLELPNASHSNQLITCARTCYTS